MQTIFCAMIAFAILSVVLGSEGFAKLAKGALVLLVAGGCIIFVFSILPAILPFIIIFGIKNVNAQDTSKSSIVMDINTGRILYENNIYEKRLIASTNATLSLFLSLSSSSSSCSF